MRSIKKIYIHCSASPDSIDFDVRDIDQWHKQRGWSGVGYHWVIKRSGLVQTGRPVEKIGAHVAGHNRGSVGICLIGTKQFTLKQMKSLIILVQSLMYQYNIDIENVLGHYEVHSGKTCPNLNMDMFRANLIFKQDEELL